MMYWLRRKDIVKRTDNNSLWFILTYIKRWNNISVFISIRGEIKLLKFFIVSHKNLFFITWLNMINWKSDGPDRLKLLIELGYKSAMPDCRRS